MNQKNLRAQKGILLAVICGVIMILSTTLITSIECDQYRKRENAAITAMVETIAQKYPDVEMSGIISILNNKSNSRQNSEILLKYGISQDMYYIESMHQMKQSMIQINIISVIILECVFVLIVLFYIRKRKAKINEITDYVNHISAGDYSLDLLDNSEDELSNLKNELYKITVTLKEQSELSKEQHDALATAVSDISHQLKTPLTSISVLVDNLTDIQDISPDISRKFLGEIARQITSLNWMVITMLKISKLDAGVVTFVNEDMNLNTLIEEVRTNLEVIAELQNVQIVTEIPEEIHIKGDYNWNREAITNIVKNAVEYSESGSKVTISVKQNSVYTRIDICNYGREITKEEQKNIFDRFYRAGDSVEHGVGIGLSLAKSIIEQQNGYIDLESDKEKTIFIIKYMN